MYLFNKMKGLVDYHCQHTLGFARLPVQQRYHRVTLDMDVEQQQKVPGKKKSVCQYVDLLKSADPGVQPRARRQQTRVPTPRAPTCHRRRRRADMINDNETEAPAVRAPPRQRTITGMFQQQQARTEHQIQQEVEQQLQERGSVDV